MKNTYVTVTWPNHWTIVTGMHAETHGVVANDFYDPVLNEVFTMGNITQEEQPQWYDNGTVGAGGEPIWVTYQKASRDHRSAMAIWPGGNADVNGIGATYRLRNDLKGINFIERINAIIKWFIQEVSCQSIHCENSSLHASIELCTPIKTQAFKLMLKSKKHI